MAEEIYNTAVDFKENLEGYEDIQDVVYYPVEKYRTRIKNTKIYTQHMITNEGIHLDRDDGTAILDNSNLKLDVQPEDKQLHAVVCPKGEYIELFNIEEDIVSNENVVFTPNQIEISEPQWGLLVPFEVPSTTSEYKTSAISEVFEFQPNKMIRHIEFKVNDGEDLNIKKFIDYGLGFVEIEDELLVEDNATASYYPNKLRWKIENQDSNPVTITKVFIKFDYFD